jgi:hypothetical protein
VQHFAIAEQDGKQYYAHPSVSDTGDVSLAMTGNELGRMMFTDALAAIKIHLLGRMMNDGHIPKGPIVDYEGSKHLPSKSFFLQYPEYAMEVVLRTLPELLASRGVKLATNTQSVEEYTESILAHPDWATIIHEIFTIPLKQAPGASTGRSDAESNTKYPEPLQDAHTTTYALDSILATHRQGANTVADWVAAMERYATTYHAT